MAIQVRLWRNAAIGLLLAAVASPAMVAAQAVVQPIPGTTDADRLGEQMRALAADPRDLAALTLAGELSLKLDDLSGAASLFARADKIDPRNARVKAGEASVLVRSERPGQALRYFAMAQSYGLDPSRFAGDRGLAYDLIGEQDRAQRDYRQALRAGADAEITRRYALSLGISGKRDEALAVLDPLLRDTDRAAWRVRAFVLAMAGDVAGAERIATTMMPPGMAEGLQPFFQRLPSLPAVDRAFAVHFGETRATPERYADARLVPPMAALGPDPTAPVAPVAVAAADPVAAPKADRNKRRDRRGRDKPGRAAIPDTRVQVAALPPPPAYRGQPIPTVAPADYRLAAPMNATARANAQALANMGTTAPVPTQAPAAALAASTPSRRTDRVTLASSGMTSLPTPRVVQGPAPGPAQVTAITGGPASATTATGTALVAPRASVAMTPATGVGVTPAGVTARAAATTAAPTAVVATGGPRETVVASSSPSTTPAPGFSAAATGGSGLVAGPTRDGPTRDGQAAALALAPTTSPAAPASTGTASTVTAPVVTTATMASSSGSPVTPAVPTVVASVPASSAPASSTPSSSIPAGFSIEKPAADRPIPTALAARTDDSILARIVAGLSIPAAELGVPTMPGARPAASEPPVIEEAAAKEARDAEAEKLVAQKAAADKLAADKLAEDKLAGARTAADEKRAADKKLADKKAADKKAVADKKALAEKKIGDAKKLEEAKAAAAEQKAARANPARTWVQVAGGAHVPDLPKAWAAVKAKAPGVFAGKQGWWTPLRATNRVLAGPFKTDDEARAFINALAKEGVSTFSFVSDKGQEITRLSTK